MAKIIGRLVNVGVARETERGVGVAPIYNLPRTEFSFDDKIVKARSISSLGKISDSDEAIMVSHYGEGDIGGELRDKTVGLFLYALLGTCTTTGSGPYTHTFTIAHNNQHPTLTLVVDDTNTKEMYKMCMINSLEVTAELESMVAYTANFMSKSGVTSGASIPAPVVENKWGKNHVQVRVAEDISGLDAAQKISLKSLTLTIEKNVTLDESLGTADPEDLVNRQISVSGEMTLNYEDDTWKGYMMNSTNRAMEVKLVDQSTTLDPSGNPTLTFRFPKVDFFDWEPDYSLDELTTQSVSFKASYDFANSQEMVSSIALINEVVSY